MEKIRFVCFIFLVFFSVTNGDTFVNEDTMDYGDENLTTIIPESSTTNSNVSMPTTSATSEISTSTIKDLGENSYEMNINQTLSIFSLKNIESKFNDLIVKLDREQIIYLNDTKNSSEILGEENNSTIKIYIENITKALEDFNENFEMYEKIKIEMEDKVQILRENYLREIITIEKNWINDQIIYYKQHNSVITKKRMLTSMEEIYTKSNETEEKAHTKDQIDELPMKIQNDSIRLKKSYKNYLNQTNLAELKMMNEMTKLLNDTKYDTILNKFDDFLKIKKTIRKLLKICTDYSAKTNILMTDFAKNLSNLSSQLILSKIMPSDSEIVKLFPKNFENLAPLTKIPQNSDMTNYKWVQAYQGNKRLSENAVVGGQDVDGVLFYVARIKDYKSYLYGKFAFSLGRRHAYFPYEYAEYGVEKFEILTSPNYIWCEFDKNKNYDELPICRAEHNMSVIPGTLEKNGICRIGYDFKVLRFSRSNFKVLRIGGC